MPMSETTDMSHFGGTESEMIAVHGYQKALRELQKSHSGPKGEKEEAQSEDEDDGENGGQKGKPKKKTFAERDAARRKKKEQDGQGADKS